MLFCIQVSISEPQSIRYTVNPRIQAIASIFQARLLLLIFDVLLLFEGLLLLIQRVP